VGAEERLLAATRDGDEGAFERLLDRYRGALRAWLYRIATNASLDVLTLAGDKIAAVDAFIVRTLDVPDGYSRWPDFAPDPEQVRTVFTRSGLPDRLGTDQFSSHERS
jgi:hypothetical protein